MIYKNRLGIVFATPKAPNSCALQDSEAKRSENYL